MVNRAVKTINGTFDQLLNESRDKKVTDLVNRKYTASFHYMMFLYNYFLKVYIYKGEGELLTQTEQKDEDSSGCTDHLSAPPASRRAPAGDGMRQSKDLQGGRGFLLLWRSRAVPAHCHSDDTGCQTGRLTGTVSR